MVRVCVFSVCVLRCALGMRSSVKNVKAKQNHRQQPKKSWIEAFLSGLQRFHPAAICILLLLPGFREDSGNISNNSCGSGVSRVFVWHESTAFLKRMTINKVGFFQCHSAHLEHLVIPLSPVSHSVSCPAVS